MHAPEVSAPDPAGRRAVTGIHVIADLYGCQALDEMTNGERLERTCVEYVREAGLFDVGRMFHQFPGEGGVTGTVVLAESHMALHTWPEHGYVSLDVFVCNYSSDNTAKARNLASRLIALFQPEDARVQEVNR
ncbi:MAG: adenosylmethionine decarboxylase [Nitrospirae bacterium]|nr:adenosylmethionine decarboxylase [Nitrospirota bacterium]